MNKFHSLMPWNTFWKLVVYDSSYVKLLSWLFHIDSSSCSSINLWTFKRYAVLKVQISPEDDVTMTTIFIKKQSLESFIHSSCCSDRTTCWCSKCFRLVYASHCSCAVPFLVINISAENSFYFGSLFTATFNVQCSLFTIWPFFGLFAFQMPCTKTLSKIYDRIPPTAFNEFAFNNCKKTSFYTRLRSIEEKFTHTKNTWK